MRPATKNSESSSTNRAEDVRRRRASRNQQRVTNVTDKIVNPVKSRPVIVRGNTFGTPIHRQAGTRARRQFYVTMDQAAGTELRLPAIRWVNPGWRVLSGLLVILAAVGVFSVWNSPFFQITNVDVQGLSRLTPPEINAAINLENRSVIEVDADEVKKTLETTYPELIDVQVAVEMPNLVTITAVERQPVIAFQNGDQVTWADADGILFPARGDAGPVLTVHTNSDLPLVPVLPDPAAEGTEAVAEKINPADPLVAVTALDPAKTGPRKVDPVLLEAAKGLGEKLPPEIQLIYSTQEGIGWTDPGGWQVYIGRDLNDFEAKYAMYQSIANHLANQGMQPTLVSVEHLNAPFYRLEQ